ncbi:MAG: polyhydroxyalkanoic acid system family protein [Dehalococcoidia bacterium]
MQVQIPHHSTKEAAKQKIESGAEKLLGEFGSEVSNVAHSWNGDTMNLSFRTHGFNIKGRVEVTSSHVIVDVGMPLLARPFENKARLAVGDKLAEFFPG